MLPIPLRVQLTNMKPSKVPKYIWLGILLPLVVVGVASGIALLRFTGPSDMRPSDSSAGVSPEILIAILKERTLPHPSVAWCGTCAVPEEVGTLAQSGPRVIGQVIDELGHSKELHRRIWALEVVIALNRKGFSCERAYPFLKSMAISDPELHGRLKASSTYLGMFYDSETKEASIPWDTELEESVKKTVNAGVSHPSGVLQNMALQESKWLLFMGRQDLATEALLVTANKQGNWVPCWEAITYLGAAKPNAKLLHGIVDLLHHPESRVRDAVLNTLSYWLKSYTSVSSDLLLLKEMDRAGKEQKLHELVRRVLSKKRSNAENAHD